MSKWGVYHDDGNVYHIMPENDLSEHTQDISFPVEPTEWFKENISNGVLVIDKGIEFVSDCKCEPKIKYILESNSWQVIHNSFDGREMVEQFYDILS